MLDKMLKNKTRLALKMFIILWFLLFLQVILKLTFNYWQPYVIQNQILQSISNFIDNNKLLQAVLNGILYFINSIFMILCSIKCWKFKSRKQFLICSIVIIICFSYRFITNDTILNSIFLTILFPIILDKSKWLYTISTFALSFVFLYFSLWLEGFVNANDMSYVTRTFLNFDYNIMLILNYFMFNFIKFKKRGEINGR